MLPNLTHVSFPNLSVSCPQGNGGYGFPCFWHSSPPPTERHGWRQDTSLNSGPAQVFPQINLLGVRASFILSAANMKRKALSWCRAWETSQGIRRPYSKVTEVFFLSPSGEGGTMGQGILYCFLILGSLVMQFRARRGEALLA